MKELITITEIKPGAADFTEFRGRILYAKVVKGDKLLCSATLEFILQAYFDRQAKVANYRESFKKYIDFNNQLVKFKNDPIMEYREYPSDKTYIVVHKTGFGVMEAPYIEKEVVYESNSLKDAKEKVDEFERKNNSAENIRSSWRYNTYWININTTTPEGGKLLEKFGKEFDRKMEKVQQGNYKAYKVGDQG